MRAGSFREDLYYRINVVSVQVPPLRERREDIPLLAQHFLEKFSRQMNRPFRSIDAAAMERLVRHPWPGNVRELANAVERALVVGTPPAVREEDLPVRVGRETAAAAAGDSLAEIEREHVKSVLERKGWNVTHAAKALEIDRATLYNKIKKYRLRQPG